MKIIRCVRVQLQKVSERVSMCCRHTRCYLWGASEYELRSVTLVNFVYVYICFPFITSQFRVNLLQMKQFFYVNIDVFFSYIRFVNPIFGIRRTFLGKGICRTVLSLLMPLSFKYSIQKTIWKTIIELTPCLKAIQRSIKTFISKNNPGLTSFEIASFIKFYLS